jgi:hypothetical protein
MKKNTTKKIRAAFLILASVLLNVRSVRADLGVDDVTSGAQTAMNNWTGQNSATDMIEKAMKELEKRYHISLKGIQQSSEMMNTSYLKRDFPQVMLTFSPSNPKEGETVTAMANPMYFSTPNEQLYYTWYIVHKNKPENSNCYLNDKGSNLDADADIEDCKIEAAKILAQGGWEPNWKDYDRLSEGDFDGYYSQVSDTDDDGYKATIGGDNSDSTSKCYIGDFVKGIAYEIVKGENDTSSKCNHLFPKAPGEEFDGISFSKEEEKFWGTNPTDPSTADNGNKDEANIAGLGQMQFSWNYQSGDKIGVAVEGRSLKPTKYDNTSSDNGASMMVMWALPKDKCDIENTGSKTITINTGTGAGFSGEEKINTTTTSVNDCLGKNLVDPAEGGQATKMKPTLSAIPENPLQDSESTDTDTINVQASFENAETSLPNIYYEWKIQAGKSMSGPFNTIDPSCDQEEWKTNKCEEKFSEINRLSGNNLSSINFKPNLAENNFNNNNSNSNSNSSSDGSGIAYLKVHLDAYENFSEGSTRVGRSDVIIKLVRPAVKLEAFVPSSNKVSASSNYSLALDHDLSTSNIDVTKICDKDTTDDSEIQKYICFVTPNQIVGARIVDNSSGNTSSSDFKYSWMLDGKPLYFDSEYCSDPDCKDGKMVYFPVSNNVGDKYNLIVNLANEKTGKTIQFGKIFEVISPYVKIVNNYDTTATPPETEASWQKYIGRYEDINGVCDNTSLSSTDKETCLKKFYDFSDSVFETNKGNTVKLKAEYHPGWIQGDVDNNYSNSKQWLLDGEEQGDNMSNDLSFTVDKDIEDVYNVEFNAIYNQSKEMRRALNQIWGITSFDTSESDLSASTQVEVVESSTVTKSNEEKAILASVLGNTSENIIFFLRLALTAALVIFVSGLVFSVAPKRRTYLG